MSLKNQKGQPAVEYLLLMSMVVSAIWMFCRPGGPGEVIVNGPPVEVGGYDPTIDSPGKPPNDPGISASEFFGAGGGPVRIGAPGGTPGPGEGGIGDAPPITMTIPSDGLIYILGKKGQPTDSLDITVKGIPAQFVVDPAPDSFDPSDLVIVKEVSKGKKSPKEGFVLEP